MRIGVVGTGHLGKIHLKCLNSTPFTLQGVFDIDAKTANEAAGIYQTQAFSSYQELLKEIDAVIVVADTTSHYDLSVNALNAGKHVFIEKPVTASLEEAHALQKLVSDSHGLIVQVGHVERYNPAFVATLPHVHNPMFIECHRLATFNPRGNDVSVILDLMIHDLDILLELVDSPIAEIRSNGVNILSSTADICNARIEFANGCVANMTASRISLKQMRKFRIFQNDAYIGIDFLEKTNQVIKLNDQKEGMLIETKDGDKYINVMSQDIQESNAIENELNDFYKAIVEKTEPKVDIHHAVKVMELAHEIESNIKVHV